MKLRCPCGNVVHDNTDNQPWVGKVIPDQTFNLRMEMVVETLLSFMEAKAHGTPTQWRENHGLNQTFTDQSFIWDVCGLIYGTDITLYECDVCGRILTLTPHNIFQSYRPEGDYPIGIFHDDAFAAKFGPASDTPSQE